MKKGEESWKDLGTARSGQQPRWGRAQCRQDHHWDGTGWWVSRLGTWIVLKNHCLMLCLHLSPLQMFIMEKVEGTQCSLHEFSVTGSTYAPEGQM